MDESETEQNDIFKLRTSGKMKYPPDLVDKEFIDVARI